VANNDESTGNPRAGQGEIGINPQSFYPFEDVCRILRLSPTVKRHLLAALQLAGQPGGFLELTEKQRFVTGSAVWAQLPAIVVEVRADARRKSEIENKRRRGKGSD
jgi:hypothetical protein